jgi:hypothetical protein
VDNTLKGERLKHLQPQTLQVLLAILSNRRFSQRGIWAICKRSRPISLGQVNKVVMYLERKGFVQNVNKNPMTMLLSKTDTRDFDIGHGKYAVVDPVGLVRFISMFRSMAELKIQTIFVDAPEQRIIKELSKEDVVFCLGTAMERYTQYYRPAEISLYIYPGKEETVSRLLGTARTGSIRIDCYKVDYIRYLGNENVKKRIIDSLFALELKGIQSTTMVQTVVDMFCDGKAVFTKPLLKKLWGVEI